MKVIDLTHTICEDMPVYPGTEQPKLTVVNTCEADGFRESLLQLYSHTGTHIDPPAHLFPDGRTLDQFPPEQFLGKALVIDCRHLKAGERITADCLKPYGDKVRQADFLLFNTGWDRYWGSEDYFGDYPCVDEEVLNRIMAGNYKGIGFDTISPDPMANVSRHRKLFSARECIIIENLTNLHLCGDGFFRFCCLPLKWEAADGAPARAVAWLEDD